MNGGKNTFTEGRTIIEGRQRESSLQKVIKHLPARSKDNFMLLVLLVMGISGLAYILTLPIGSNANKKSLFSKIFKAEDGKSITSDFIKSKLLKIEGEMKTNLPIVFTFTDLSEQLEYKLHLDNKQFSSLEANHHTYTFSEPGTYKVEMKKINAEQETVVHCEYLKIQ